MIRRTSINPLDCMALGLVHIVHGLVLLLSCGMLSTGLPHAAVLSIARKSSQPRKGGE